MNRNLRATAFKQIIAIEALKGDKTVNEIAKENGVQLRSLRENGMWKTLRAQDIMVVESAA